MTSKLLPVFILLITSPLFAQLQNADFENWSDSSAKPMLEGWDHMAGHINRNYKTTDLFGTYRSDTVEHGKYALTVSRWYSYTMDWARQIVPITSRPAALRGYYTYSDNVLTGPSLDTATVHVSVTRWNVDHRDTIGYVEIDLGATEQFTPFLATIKYTSELMPDSLNVSIAPSVMRAQGVAPNGWGCYLTVDNLSVEGDAKVENTSDVAVGVFPNPASDKITVESAAQFMTGELYDDLGRLLLRDNISGKNTIDLRGLERGHYNLLVRDGKATHSFSVVKN